MRSRLVLPFAFVLAVLFSFPSLSVAQSSREKAAATSAQLDINSASKADLMALPGIGEAYSQKIVDGRPYQRKDELVTRKTIPEATYDTIKDQIIAKQTKT
jgi:DNA uptake protein ComE-like DNA-binding protein